MLLKVISGGQTGADRAGLDAAIECGIEHGGHCPRGRRAEDGRIPDKYNLTETASAGYVERTKLNVLNSDFTLMFCFWDNEKMTPGTQMTADFCRKYSKDWCCFNLGSDISDEDRVDSICSMLWDEHRILNIAGSRESKHPGIYDRVKFLLTEAFKRTNGHASLEFADQESQGEASSRSDALGHTD